MDIRRILIFTPEYDASVFPEARRNTVEYLSSFNECRCLSGEKNGD